MSGYILPVLPGQKFPARKSPIFSTKRQKALSGKESALSFRAYPLYSFDLEYEFLSDNFPQAPARTNYVLYSQNGAQFGPGNGGTGLPSIAIANYTTSPDGTLTATRLILNRGAGNTSADFSFASLSVASVPAGSTNTVSFWAKTNDGSSVVVRLNGSSLGYQPTITPNWTRYSAPWSPSITSGGISFELAGVVGTSNYADISVWGIQAEPGSYATAYIPTSGSAVRISDLKTMFGIFSQMLGSYDTFLYQDQDFNTVQLQQFATGNGSTTAFNLTATYKAGTDIVQYGNPAPVLGLAGVPEWIQNTNGPPQIYTARYGGPELLSTGSRTNLTVQSNFASSWSIVGGTLTANSTTAPDGTVAAAKFTEGSATQQWGVLLSQAGFTGGARYAFSVWLKYIGRQYAQLVFDIATTDAVYATFDLVNGVFGSVGLLGTAYASNADIRMVAYPNGWYRCSISGQLAAADTTLRVGISPAASLSSARYPSMAGLNADSYYMWGAQLELGTQPTALIGTSATHANNGGSDYSLTNLATAGSVSTFQQVSFASAPANNVPLLWSGSFFYRCRFSEDSLDFQKDFGSANAGTGIWSLKRLSFDSIIL